MRTSKIRVRRRHQRSIRLSMILLMFTLAIYLLSLAFGDAPAARTSAPQAPEATAAISVERVTRDVKFDALDAYLVELGTAATADEARIEAARYVLRGAAGYVLQDGDTFRVIGAAYDELEDAQRVALRLLEEEGIPASVFKYSSQPAAVRITATQSQIDELAYSDQTIRMLTAKLGALAVQLDGGAQSVESAREQLRTMQAEAYIRQRALEAALAGDKQQFTTDMLSVITVLDGSLREQMNGSYKSALSFSAQIKYNKITMRVRHIQMLNTLTM